MTVTHSRSSLCNLLALLFVLLTAIPVEIIGVLLTHRAWDRELQTVHEEHLQLARYLAEALTQYAEDVAATFQLIASVIAGHRPTENITATLDQLHLKYVCVVDGAGRVEHLLSPNADLNIERFAGPFLDQLRPSGSAAVFSVVFSDVLPDHQGDPTKPIGDARYAIGALNTDYIVRLQSAVRFGQTGHAVIVHRRGRLIAHPAMPWRAAMRDMSQEPPVRRVMAGETGVLRFFSPAAQDDVVASFATASKTGWGVIIPQPVSELEARVDLVKHTVWSVICLALLAATILSVFVARLLAAPLRHIGLVAERFANGSYEARVNDGAAFYTRETATLAAQFNAMAEEINRSWQALHDIEERSREFAQIAADWFWETNCQQVFTYISSPSINERQWDATQALGRHRREHVAGDPEGEVVARIQSYMDRGVSFDNVSYQVLGNDGQPIYVSVAGRPMRDATGAVVGYRGIARDITERLSTQAQLHQARQEELLRHARKMEAIGILAGGIAHDFNNILAAILGFTQLTLYEISQDSKAWGHLQEVLVAGRRAKDLVQQILTFSRESEQVRQPIYVHLVVKEALKLLRASLPTTITIIQNIPEDAGTILADPTQIHQVMMNLCANAEYAMRETGGVLEIRQDIVEVDQAFAAQHPTLRPGSHIRLTVRDTGCGMTPEIMERIFDPFFTTKVIGQGIGMGLAVVHGIVTDHNGAITVQSSPGEGTTFEIYLPQSTEAVQQDAARPRPLPTGTASILFVDDEQALALLGREMLGQLGYEVIATTSSSEALAIFRKTPHRFDLVITDQTMSHMTGAALARELRRIRPDIPIILCTGFSHVIDTEKAEAQDIDVFLMKPLMSHDLALAVQRVLPQPMTQKVDI